MASWLSVKLNWINQDSRQRKVELQAQAEFDRGEAQIQPEVGWVIPEGVTLFPAPSSQLDFPPAEVVVTFPFQPRSPDLTVQLDEVVLTQPEDDLIIRGKSLVYPLPTNVSSGIYSVKYSGCPEAVSDAGCIRGTYGFTVKGDNIFSDRRIFRTIDATTMVVIYPNGREERRYQGVVTSIDIPGRSMTIAKDQIKTDLVIPPETSIQRFIIDSSFTTDRDKSSQFQEPKKLSFDEIRQFDEIMFFADLNPPVLTVIEYQ
ncbi:MAG: hypothetical protein HY381_02600 [Candidatus Chisholmbacteria bacterium]|nr:hypothetical protein [Candidatus Chisholmbacteria bacterium]